MPRRGASLHRVPSGPRHLRGQAGREGSERDRARRRGVPWIPRRLQGLRDRRGATRQLPSLRCTRTSATAPRMTILATAPTGSRAPQDPKRAAAELSPYFGAPSFAGGHARNEKKSATPSLSTSNLCQTRGLAASPGSCRTVIAMTKHAVVIAGGGPTGLMLAAELALARVDVAIVERRANQDLAGSRAGGLHSRTIEVLDQRGIADRFLSQGQVAQVAGFDGTTLDISDFPTRHNYGLGLWQNHIERILAGWVGELAVPIYRGREVTAFSQDDTGVDVELSDGQSLRADYLVGCDGGRSLVRKTAGIEFPGWDPTTSSLIAVVET